MDEKFKIKKCPNCNGYGTFSYGKHVCITCKGKGVIVIDSSTGRIVDDEGEKDVLENPNF